MKPIIILGCDEKFVEHTKAVLASLDQHPALRKISIGLLDGGLSDESLAWFEEKGVHVRKAEWDIDFPQLPEWQQKLSGYKILISRPFMPKYFPEFDVYLWMDSDLWVQTPNAIIDFLNAARWSAFTAVLEFDRNYHSYRTGPKWWRFFHNIHSSFFSKEVADRLLHCPNINAGVFCMRRDAPHWKIWQDTLSDALSRPHPIDKNAILIEQASLNVAIYANDLHMALLPATHNWSCLQALPVWNEQAKLLVEPHPPHAPISVIHMTGPTKGRVFQLPVLMGNGRKAATALDYHAVQKNFFS